MYYTCLQVTCDPSYTEILMAEVAEAGFESFIETESGFEAYVELEKFDEPTLSAIIEQYALPAQLDISYERVKKQNWNEEWEKSYEPINVEGRCLIRASFHKPD